MKADPSRLEAIASQDRDRMTSIAGRAKEAGVIAHRFYGSDDGQIMVIDEWPDAQSFHSFFEEQSPNIGPLMEETGVQGEPEVTVWRKLETGDDVGWGS
jgi:hypothetical protein